MVPLFQKTVWQFLVIIDLSFDPSIIFLGIYSRIVKRYIHTKPVHDVIAALFVTTKNWR